MKNFSEPTTLGRTGLKVGRLGISHFYKGLKRLGLDYVDALMLGYYPNKPRKQLMDLVLDLCMTGARTLEIMRENLETLDSGPLAPEEMKRVRRIGDHIYAKLRL